MRYMDPVNSNAKTMLSPDCAIANGDHRMVFLRRKKSGLSPRWRYVMRPLPNQFRPVGWARQEKDEEGGYSSSSSASMAAR